MPNTVDKIAAVAREVLRDCQIDADVLGVTRAEGDPAYVEVLIELGRTRGRIAVGVDDNGTLDDLRAGIAGRLGGAIHGGRAAE